MATITHLIRENRENFISRIVTDIRGKTGSNNVVCFRTANVAFFLITQDRHSQYLLGKAKVISDKWDGQIQIC